MDGKRKSSARAERKNVKNFGRNKKRFRNANYMRNISSGIFENRRLFLCRNNAGAFYWICVYSSEVEWRSR